MATVSCEGFVLSSVSWIQRTCLKHKLFKLSLKPSQTAEANPQVFLHVAKRKPSKLFSGINQNCGWGADCSESKDIVRTKEKKMQSRVINFSMENNYCSMQNTINSHNTVWPGRSGSTNQSGWTQAGNTCCRKWFITITDKSLPQSSKRIIPITPAFLIIFIKQQLRSPTAMISTFSVLERRFHLPESAECSGLFYLWVAALDWKACPFSDLFSSASLTAPLAEYARICWE